VTAIQFTGDDYIINGASIVDILRRVFPANFIYWQNSELQQFSFEEAPTGRIEYTVEFHPPITTEQFEEMKRHLAELSTFGITIIVGFKMANNTTRRYFHEPQTVTRR
jgi:hypothetical protein